jgi:hypothetical protein
MKPLDSTTEEETLMLMDMWTWGHKVNAAKRYNDIIIKNTAPFTSNEDMVISMKQITTSYEVLNKYFQSF